MRIEPGRSFQRKRRGPPLSGSSLGGLASGVKIPGSKVNTPRQTGFPSSPVYLLMQIMLAQEDGSEEAWRANGLYVGKAYLHSQALWAFATPRQNHGETQASAYRSTVRVCGTPHPSTCRMDASM